MYKISFINESGLKKTYKTRFEGVLNTLKRRFYETQSDKGLYDDFMFNTNCLKCE
jgi:excinuclease UvrABC ATPase subunit